MVSVVLTWCKTTFIFDRPNLAAVHFAAYKPQVFRGGWGGAGYAANLIDMEMVLERSLFFGPSCFEMPLIHISLCGKVRTFREWTLGV